MLQLSTYVLLEHLVCDSADLLPVDSGMGMYMLHSTLTTTTTAFRKSSHVTYFLAKATKLHKPLTQFLALIGRYSIKFREYRTPEIRNYGIPIAHAFFTQW